MAVAGAEDREWTQQKIANAAPHAEFVWDTGEPPTGALSTLTKAFKLAGDDAAVFMEDDAIPTTDFVTKLETAIAERPHDIIQFFSRRKKDKTIGSRYESYFSSHVCVYFPATMARQLLAYYPIWAVKNLEPHPTGTDHWTAEYFKYRKLRHWIHVPSLAQHSESVSIIDSRRARRRVSETFIP